MKSDTNTAANAEPGVQTEDFAERVRVNQAKLTSELRPHYDFMVFDGPVDSRSQGAVPRLTHAGPAEEIVGKELIAYDIASDGNWFRMSFSCVNGKQGSLRLPTECLKALIMTLPRMMIKALSARYGDDSLRLVYPAEVVRIEGSRDPNTFILTLTTPDGFAVSFSLSGQQLDALSQEGTLK